MDQSDKVSLPEIKIGDVQMNIPKAHQDAIGSTGHDDYEESAAVFKDEVGQRGQDFLLPSTVST